MTNIFNKSIADECRILTPPFEPSSLKHLIISLNYPNVLIEMRKFHLWMAIENSMSMLLLSQILQRYFVYKKEKNRDARFPGLPNSK